VLAEELRVLLEKAQTAMKKAPGSAASWAEAL
jgi:hypothetical protein